MENKVRVFGKAQNRTALGIINAYLKIHPKATQSDLNQAFPADLNQPALNASKLPYLLISEAEKNRLRADNTYKAVFEDSPIVLKDETKLFLVMLWQKPEFEKIIEWAKQYGIEVADYKPAEGFTKGGYRLEYLNGFDPLVPKKGKKSLWFILLIILVVLAILSYFLL